jgi:hypothetical protein
METDAAHSKSIGGSSLTQFATVFFVLYGGYLLFIVLTIGLPSEHPFARFDVEIPAPTLMAMDTPIITWVVGYALAAVFLCVQSARPAVGRLMTFFNLSVAVLGMLILYAVYQAVAVMPGTKIMAVLDLL